MSAKSRRPLLAVCVAAFLFLFSVGPALGASKGDVVKRLEDFRRFFIDFQLAPDNAIPGELLAQCYGVIIMRQYRAGFVLGVRGGDGVIFLREPVTGAWSGPAFVVSAEGSFGFQIGGQSIDAIMLIMNRDGVEMLLKSRFQVGVDASAAAGPVGRAASAKVGPGTAILAYSRAKGLYAGVAFEGGAMLNYDDYNRAMYGMNIEIKDILITPTVPVPPEAYPILEAIQASMIFPAPQPAPAAVSAPAQPAPSQWSQTQPTAQPQPVPAQPFPTAPAPTTQPWPPAPAPAPVVQPWPPAPPPAAVPSPSANAPARIGLPPPLPEPGPSQARSADQMALDRAAADAAETARAASDAAARAQAAAADAAARAAAARQPR